MDAAATAPAQRATGTGGNGPTFAWTSDILPGPPLAERLLRQNPPCKVRRRGFQIQNESRGGKKAFSISPFWDVLFLPERSARKKAANSKWLLKYAGKRLIEIVSTFSTV